MGRKAIIEGDALMAKLSDMFRRVGYEGATLARLSETTGLKKPSLYHRFPGGKEQMACEVLDDAGRWLATHVLEPLTADGSPRARIEHMASQLDRFYRGGEQACLLNLLSAPLGSDGPFQDRVSAMFEAFIDAIAAVVTEDGIAPAEARLRAERAVAQIQGSLVLSRGLGRTEPFRDALSELPDRLLGQ
ncbi:TetR/AcrR family transcriptional regulator [Allopontixanthobacter sp.]|uniref:TetR/AcrR family transcriptional regulator n=1 Tax=Allopontixanthobacter sp. TaxID=2906452 RepID=UPI002ABCDF9A|nr:TetR/AcrR family transcriptional regulator [Allopontixanthobacter sp.]MDZ4307212.1 TetR/AcrR family transcriptional regulator [Allopontixanthobacter sp.]